MIKQWRTYGNLIIDLEATNKKPIALKQRRTAAACDISEDEAQQLPER